MRFRRLLTAVLVMCATVALGAAQSQRTYRAGEDGVVPPRLEKDVKPQYTPEAREARIQGMVTVEAVVLAD